MANRVGQRLGRWTLVEPIEQGGNADVWRGESDEAAPAAIKLLRGAGGDRYPRFCDEVAFLRSPIAAEGVLPLLDAYLPDRPSRRDPAWLTMPLATPIRAALGDEPALSAVVEAVATTGRTLARLAAEGVGHRDVKPDNLFRLDDRWVIGDFGLVTYPGKRAITSARRKLGPIHFIAPEMLNAPDDAASQPADVFSLAKTLWALASGQAYPLPGEYRLEDPAYQLASYVAGERTAQLDRLIERCTRVDPARRPTLDEVAAELEAWLLPATRQQMTEDPTTVAERIRLLSEPTHRSEQLDKRREREVADGLETLSAVLNEIRPALEKAFVHVQVHRDIGFLERWGVWPTVQQLRSTGEICLHARTPGLDPIAIVFAVGLQWLGDERLRLAAGIGIEDEYAGPVQLWSSIGVATIGSSLFDSEVRRIGTAMADRVMEGLTRTASRMEMRSDRDHYASWGSEGSDAGQLRSPWSVFSSSGQDGCFVVDTFNNRLQRFSPGGRLLSTPHLGAKGSGPGQLDFPTGGCVDFDGYPWVADHDNARVVQFDVTGSAQNRQIGERGSGRGQLLGPADVAADPANNLYVVDRRRCCVVRYRYGGDVIGQWGEQGRDPGQFSVPCGIAVELGRFVYVSDSGNNRVQKFTVEGELVAIWGQRGQPDVAFKTPHGIALDRDENVYIADCDMHRIQILTADGELIRRVGAGGGDGTPGQHRGQFVQPRGVSVDAARNVYVAEFGASRVQRFSPGYFGAL